MDPCRLHGLQNSLNGFATQGGRLLPPIALLCVGLAATVILETLRARALRLDFEPYLLVTTIDAADVDSRNEGRLVHTVGDIRATRDLVDPVFGVRSQALRMWRRVETLGEDGWEPAQEVIGGSIGPWRADTRDVVLGSFQVDPRMVRSLDETVPLRHYRATLPEGARAQGETIHLNGNPEAPEPGDSRVRFEVVPEKRVTLLGEQRGTRLGVWHSSRGEPLGGLLPGEQPASALLPPLRVQIHPWVWLARAGVFLALLAGCQWFFQHLVWVIPPGPASRALAREPRRNAVALAAVCYFVAAGLCWSTTLSGAAFVLILSALAVLAARSFFLIQTLRSSAPA